MRTVFAWVAVGAVVLFMTSDVPEITRFVVMLFVGVPLSIYALGSTAHDIALLRAGKYDFGGRGWTRTL